MEDWAGITRNLGIQVKAMLSEAGMDLLSCPSPAQVLNLNYTIPLPGIPTLLSILNIINVSTSIFEYMYNKLPFPL